MRRTPQTTVDSLAKRDSHSVHRRTSHWQRVLLTTALVVSAAPMANACSPMKAIGMYFERDSSVVSAAQVLRLADWMAGLRARYPNHEAIEVGTSAEPGEHMPNQLGLARARNVARVLHYNLQFEESKIHLPSRGDVVKPIADYIKAFDKSEGVRGLQLDFLPACPHECPCQFGDPLYDPAAPHRIVPGSR